MIFSSKANPDFSRHCQKATVIKERGMCGHDLRVIVWLDLRILFLFLGPLAGGLKERSIVRGNGMHGGSILGLFGARIFQLVVIVACSRNTLRVHRAAAGG